MKKPLAQLPLTRRAMLAGSGAISAASVLSPALAHAASGERCDVIVVGSGAAGATAALFAQDAGARVIMLEKGVSLGGTSAKSGGNYWVPNNFELRKRGLSDSRAGFLRYAVRTSYPAEYNPDHETLGIDQLRYDLIGAFYDNADGMVTRLAEMKALQSQIFQLGNSSIPDYYGDLPEDERPLFRILSPLGRQADGSSGGDELMSQLLTAVRQRGVEIRLKSRVTGLIREKDAVVGVTVEDGDGETYRLHADKGVILAAGGFAHNQDLLARYQEGPVFGSCATPTATGDVVSLAQSVGAQLGNMHGAWRAPVVMDDAAKYVAVPVDVFGVAADSSIFANLQGKRCVNERRSYHDRTRTMYRWDPGTSSFPNLFHIVVYDQRAADLYAGVMPIPPAPTGIDYVISGETLDDLAQSITARLESLSATSGQARLSPDFVENLKATIERFNGFARTGIDLDFRRGQGAIDKFSMPVSPTAKHPTTTVPSPTMYPLSEEGPFYAIILGAGVLDTNGGPVIDAKARILANDGQPIPGLFGAGNCIASPSGNTYWAAGCTLALAMTFGMIAGSTATAVAKQEGKP